jgi:hypothetical protein
MKTDPGLLSVKRVIIHEVPQHSSKTEGQKPTLSDIESPLTTEIRGMLRVRIIEAVGSEKRGFDIDWDPASTSPIPGLVKSYLADPSKTDFVLMSQQMANHLYSSQPPISPAGLVIVVECTLDPLFAIVIIKIEKEEGARIIRQDVSGGKKTFDIRHYKDLILTPRTKVFKLALFVGDKDNGEARACDNQRAYTSYKELADFFLQRFLGCRMAEIPSVSTKKFYENTSQFLSAHFRSDSEKYAQLYNHLVSELTSQKTSLSPKKFAEHFIPAKHRKLYVDFLKEQGMSLGNIDKDLDLLQARLKKTVYDFASGAALIVPSKEVEERITMENQDDGGVRVQFVDRLRDVHGRG